MADFQIGEVVDVTIKGARVSSTYGLSWNDEDMGTMLVFRTCEHTTCQAGMVNIGDPGVTVERVAPAEWPPQKADLWRDRSGDLWFAVDDGEVWLTSDGYEREISDWVRSNYGPLTLVYREEPEDGSR